MTQLRYLRAEGRSLDEMYTKMRESPLFQLGDCILVWVNEGDFWMSKPIEVVADDVERKEYLRLRQKFEGY